MDRIKLIQQCGIDRFYLVRAMIAQDMVDLVKSLWKISPVLKITDAQPLVCMGVVKSQSSPTIRFLRHGGQGVNRQCSADQHTSPPLENIPTMITAHQTSRLEKLTETAWSTGDANLDLFRIQAIPVPKRKSGFWSRFHY